jgi:hypothetical protein
MFEQIAWKEDRALLGNLVFRLEHYRTDRWELGERCFRFYKIKRLIDQYEQAFAKRPGWRPQHVLEIGMSDGGSLAFWFDLLHPEKMAGLDLKDRTDSEYFREYISDRGLGHRIKTYWKTDQADPEALGRILGDLGGRLDLVMDDGSHLYSPSKTSFEYLFPRMPEGALYIIEDWAWAHWAEWQAPDHPWVNEVPLTRLVFDLVEASGTSMDVVRSVDVFEGFAIVERGPKPASELAGFRLENHILRRPEPPPGLRSALRNVIKALRDLIKALRLRSVRFLSHHRSSK